MMHKLIEECRAVALQGDGISEQQAVDLLNLPTDEVMDLMAAADAVRRRFKGSRVSMCSIVNARSGRCGEDCAFCSQSVHATSEVPEYSLMDSDGIINAARKAMAEGSHKFGIVTSGKGPGNTNGDFEAILASVKRMGDELGIHRCASLGVINEEQARALKEAGLKEFHHNLETARSFYPTICTTRDYEENIATVKAAKAAGLRICSGGILGMGESAEQRVEMALELRGLDVDSIPLNFLNPIKGTKLESIERLKPLEILAIVAVYRLLLPQKDIKVAGGREVNLRDLQSMVFFAGANSIMLGNYLTTQGRSADDDITMVADLGLDAVTC